MAYPMDVIFTITPEGKLELGAEFEQKVRQIARDEVASLAGLMLERVGQALDGRDEGGPVYYGRLASWWGEALQQFGQGTVVVSTDFGSLEANDREVEAAGAQGDETVEDAPA